MGNLNVEAPWERFAKQLHVLFEGDECIDVGLPMEYEEGSYFLRITATTEEKYNALAKRLPVERDYGNVTLHIMVCLQGADTTILALKDYETIFKGNTAFMDVKKSQRDYGMPQRGYVRFWPEVMQFYDDNLADADGLWSGLAQDIAADVFREKWGDVCFCTAPKEENTED